MVSLFIVNFSRLTSDFTLKLVSTTLNFIKSDIHLLNAGFYSPIWAHFQPKKKNRVIIRLDGVGLDSEDITIR